MRQNRFEVEQLHPDASSRNPEHKKRSEKSSDTVEHPIPRYSSPCLRLRRILIHRNN
jgi:hypothetical protein